MLQNELRHGMDELCPFHRGFIIVKFHDMIYTLFSRHPLQLGVQRETEPFMQNADPAKLRALSV